MVLKCIRVANPQASSPFLFCVPPKRSFSICPILPISMSDDSQRTTQNQVSVLVIPDTPVAMNAPQNAAFRLMEMQEGPRMVSRSQAGMELRC
ncbi:hypothetical protein Leryth_016546 [Lithospermum erythrorhizon]|nr:hypothetical protein Leryth_016546 [Lithospermum erythrorhizon]